MRDDADIERLETRHGPMFVFKNDMGVGHSLRLYGEYSEGEIELFEQLVQPGNTVVEAGSNIGAHSVRLAQLCAPGPLHVFEPQQRLFQVLCANLVVNDLRNVIAHPDACGERAGRMFAPALNFGAADNFASMPLVGPEEGHGIVGRLVAVAAIDDLDLPACHLIKADVEGCEADVLRGAARTIARHRPILYLENDRRDRQAELVALVDSYGYRQYWHEVFFYREANFRGVKENVFGATISLNMICVPKESSLGVVGFAEVDLANPTYNTHYTDQ